MVVMVNDDGSGSGGIDIGGNSSSGGGDVEQ